MTSWGGGCILGACMCACVRVCVRERLGSEGKGSCHFLCEIIAPSPPLVSSFLFAHLSDLWRTRKNDLVDVRMIHNVAPAVGESRHGLHQVGTVTVG